jgi:hypothetical protein
MSQQDLAKSLKNNEEYKKVLHRTKSHFVYIDEAIIKKYSYGDAQRESMIRAGIGQHKSSKLRGLNTPTNSILLRFKNYGRAQRFIRGTFGEGIDAGHVGTTGAMGAMQGKLKSSRARGKMPVVQGLASARDTQNQKVLQVINVEIPGTNIDFLKDVSDKFIKSNLNYQLLMPQDVDLNQKQIKKIETVYINEVKKLAKTILTQEGSKSIMQAVDAVLDTTIKGKRKAKRYKSSTSASVKPVSKKKALPLPRLRDTKGRFTSVASIQQLIQAQITEQVKDNMGEGGSLVNRTGRFAESVTITNVTQTRQGSLTAFYNYMKYPYQTFERGFKQGSTRRDPRLLIHKSIREIAQKLVHRKLNIKSRRV